MYIARLPLFYGFHTVGTSRTLGALYGFGVLVKLQVFHTSNTDLTTSKFKQNVEDKKPKHRNSTCSKHCVARPLAKHMSSDLQPFFWTAFPACALVLALIAILQNKLQIILKILNSSNRKFTARVAQGARIQTLDYDSLYSNLGCLPRTEICYKSPELEFQEYMAHQDDSENPLEFWHRNRHRFPRLYKLSRRVLIAPASTASVERMFSKAGIILAPRRLKTGDESFESQIFGHMNRYLFLKASMLKSEFGEYSKWFSVCQDLLNIQTNLEKNGIYNMDTWIR